MTSNQLENNEILVHRENFENLDQPEEKKKVWREYRVWELTLNTNQHYYELKDNPERLDKISEFYEMLLNNQKEFLLDFWQWKKNKAWKGDPEPKVLPINIDVIDYLHITWYPEVQPKNPNQYLHVHVSMRICFRPTFGLSMEFKQKYFQDLVIEIFGKKFRVDIKYGRDNALAIEMYNSKNQPTAQKN